MLKYLQGFDWGIFLIFFFGTQCVFVGIFALLGKRQRRKEAKKEVLSRMANKEYFTHTFPIDWKGMTLIGLAFSGIKYLKNKQKKEESK
jgi:hypothetical protein